MSNASVYSDLRDAITTGQIRPNEHLIESELTARYDAGRLAIRNALVRLEQEGLVERERHRSARVRLVSPKEAVEIYEHRAVLESWAARKAAQNASEAQIAQLAAMVESIDDRLTEGRLAEAAAANAALHEKILEISDDQTAQRLVGSLNGPLVQYHYQSLIEWDVDHHDSADEHRRIIDALAAHDSDAAEQAMREHLDNATRSLERSLASRVR